MLASRRPWTSFGQSAFLSGTSRPLEHFRPAVDNRFVASAIANALFSTACHFPYALAKGLVAMAGSAAGFTSAGFSVCAAKMTFELGYTIPFINCERFATGCEV